MKRIALTLWYAAQVVGLLFLQAAIQPDDPSRNIAIIALLAGAATAIGAGIASAATAIGGGIAGIGAGIGGGITAGGTLLGGGITSGLTAIGVPAGAAGAIGGGVTTGIGAIGGGVTGATGLAGGAISGLGGATGGALTALGTGGPTAMGSSILGSIGDLGAAGYGAIGTAGKALGGMAGLGGPGGGGTMGSGVVGLQGPSSPLLTSAGGLSPHALDMVGAQATLPAGAPSIMDISMGGPAVETGTLSPAHEAIVGGAGELGPAAQSKAIMTDVPAEPINWGKVMERADKVLTRMGKSMSESEERNAQKAQAQMYATRMNPIVMQSGQPGLQGLADVGRIAAGNKQF